MHWKLSVYRLSCNLHLTNSYSSLYLTRILILTHAKPIRSSTTKKELSYTVPLKLLKHINPLPRTWLWNPFPFFGLTEQVSLSYRLHFRVAFVSGYCYRDAGTHFRSLHWIPQYGEFQVSAYLHGDTRTSLRTMHVCGIQTTLLEGIGVQEQQNCAPWRRQQQATKRMLTALGTLRRVMKCEGGGGKRSGVLQLQLDM